MSGRTIRVGLIGYGFAGRSFHAPLIRAVEGLELTVIGSSRMEAIQAEIPGVIVCDPDQVATHPEVDLVVVASPNDSHLPLARAALQAGKDVVVDKPFTVTLDEARTLKALAKQHGRLLSVFHNRRWESETFAAKAALESGQLGRVVQYECHMDRYRPNVRDRWRENPGPGAGLWFDLGPHLIDLAVYFFGLPQTVSASFGVLRDGGKTDDWAHVILGYDRLKVILQATLLAAGGGPRTIIHGTRASWMKFGQDVQEKQSMAGMMPWEPGYGVDPDGGFFIDGATGEKTDGPPQVGAGPMYYAGIRDAIRNGTSPEIGARDAVAVMAILETTFASGASGKVLPLPLTAEELAEWA
jgi:predicted dehydrogenase